MYLARHVVPHRAHGFEVAQLDEGAAPQLAIVRVSTAENNPGKFEIKKETKLPSVCSDNEKTVR